MNENERWLISENEPLKAAMEQILVRVADLEIKLKENLSNSSKPPNSDMRKKRQPPISPTGRNRGGPPRREGSTRVCGAS